MSFFKSRRSGLLNAAFLCLFLGCWIYSYMSPVVKGLFTEDEEFLLKDFETEGYEVEDYLFYGTVSHASIPSIFGGSNIPFFDKVTFRLNEDDDVNFVLYASQEMLDEMSEWFSFGGVDAATIPLEIRAARLEDNKYIVHYMASADGELDVETLVLDYQFYYVFLGFTLLAFLGLLGLVLLILWLAIKKPRHMIRSAG